jgi:hypothetical protein
MTFLTGKTLTRRTMLKGIGASVALPLLDSMMPALSAQQTASRQAPMRLGFVYAAHGVIHSEWKPRQTGRQYDLPPNLQPLAGVRDHFNIFTNLSHLEADSKGDGSGDHNRAAGAWLTGVHAYDRTRPGTEIRLAASADQIAAKHLGKDSRVPSIEMTLDPATQGACDSGDCFYVNTVSWRSDTSPNMPEIHPRVIFERLFGDGGSAEQRRVRIGRQGSLLDSVLEETQTLTATLGRSDTSKVREYLDSVREVEQRIQHAESSLEESIELPDRPIGIPASFEEYAQLMFDLQLLAFRSDITRVFSLIMARELSGRSYSQIGVPGNHHLISHHREDAQLKSQKARIDTHHMRLLNYFLERMRDIPDGDGSLLDHSAILFGSGMGDGNLHRHNDLPVLMAGKLRGTFQTGYSFEYTPDTPMANLLVTMLDHSAILFGSGMGDGNLHRHNDLPVLMAGKLRGTFQTGYSFDYTPDTPMANLLVTMLDHVGVPIAQLGDSTGQLLLDYERAGAAGARG